MARGLLYWHCVVCGDYHNESCLVLKVPDVDRPRDVRQSLGLCLCCYNDHVMEMELYRERPAMWTEDRLHLQQRGSASGSSGDVPLGSGDAADSGPGPTDPTDFGRGRSSAGDHPVDSQQLMLWQGGDEGCRSVECLTGESWGCPSEIRSCHGARGALGEPDTRGQAATPLGSWVLPPRRTRYHEDRGPLGQRVDRDFHSGKLRDQENPRQNPVTTAMPTSEFIGADGVAYTSVADATP